MREAAQQLCPDCGSPLRPCRCDRELGRKTPGSTLRTKTRLKARSFSERFDGTGERYGTLFRIVRKMRCFLWIENYYGPGHECCGPGVQDSGHAPDGQTAHHTGKTDEEGLLPACGKAHDLAAGLGGRSTRKAFQAFLDERGIGLREMALRYVDEAKLIAKEENDGGE